MYVDPGFVSRTAAELEVDPDRVEFHEQQRDTDFAFRHMAMALRAGVHAGRAGDQMYGEALSTALAVHLLREYCGISMRQQHARDGLSREKLMRAPEYIEEQLQTELTVSAIARSVHISSHHFYAAFQKSHRSIAISLCHRSPSKKSKGLIDIR
jgi:AraC family transcriptional regulator